VIASTILPNSARRRLRGPINTDVRQGGGRLANLPRSIRAADSVRASCAAGLFLRSNTGDRSNLKTPRTHQWALDLQREVARIPRSSVSYIGRRAYHLLGAYNVNQSQSSTTAPRRVQKRREGGRDSPLMNNILQSRSRLNAGETGSQMVRRLFASKLSLNSVGRAGSSIATRLQTAFSHAAFRGLPFFFTRSRNSPR